MFRSGEDGPRLVRKPQTVESVAVEHAAPAVAVEGLGVIGRLVLRQIIDEASGKLFKHSDAINGTGSSIYLKGINEHPTSKHEKAIPFETIRRLPELLADPLAIFKSSSESRDPDSYKVALQAQVDGQQVIAAIKPNIVLKNADSEDAAHYNDTLFTAPQKQLQDWNEKGLLRYVDENASRTGLDAHQQSVRYRGTGSVASHAADYNASAQDLTSNAGLTGESSITENPIDFQAGVDAAKKAGGTVITKAEVAALPAMGGGRILNRRRQRKIGSCKTTNPRHSGVRGNDGDFVSALL